jgi:transposase-like protein
MKKHEQTPNQERRKFDPAFKREAVNHWLASGQSAAKVAAELGVSAHHLYGWRADLEPTGGLSTASLEAQLAATRRELARVSEQRDILKKTLGILSEPLPNDMNGSTP